jgi:peptidoglycan/LPS O-acetylase OafA/YrhL
LDLGQHLLVAIAVAPLFLFILRRESAHAARHNSRRLLAGILVWASCAAALFALSDSMPQNKALYCMFPVFMLGVTRLLAQRSCSIVILNGRHQELGFWLGRISYALYLVHYPILLTFKNLTDGSMMIALGAVGVSFMVAHCLELKFQPVMARWFLPERGA